MGAVTLLMMYGPSEMPIPPLAGCSDKIQTAVQVQRTGHHCQVILVLITPCYSTVLSQGVTSQVNCSTDHWRRQWL